MARDTRTFGFNREDAIELVNLIGNADTVVTEGIPRDNGPALFRCHQDGLQGTTTAGEWESADCMLLRSDGTEVIERKVYNPTSQDLEGDSVFIAVNIAGKWFACASGGGGALQFFRLTSDVSGTIAYARRCDYAGTLIDPGEDPTEVRNWRGLLDGAEEDYLFLGGIEQTSKEWVFVQGPCISGGSSSSSPIPFSLVSGLGI